ncbi:Ig-specific serine endopeptidase MIP [Mycoplasmopsis verecunda]|uniref:Putative peptidase n=1 Tax=Mycoplasmopsis verecunda TaxID=171291 RepID=A0A1T4KME3_9BACT|nr:DUF31 family protein [Mycoplasmopsis verecunda]WPB54299.1 hypothetical protein SAM46_02305 [Mycoplasmopsis verecunda]SJZ43612.1 Putative peptidase [Mycoplasmopsis verecunda]
MKIKTIKNLLLMLAGSSITLLPVSCFHTYPERPTEPPKDPNVPQPVEPPKKDPHEGDPVDPGPVIPPLNGGGNNHNIPDSTTPSNADSDSYINASLLNKYYYDETPYINALVRYLWGNDQSAYEEIYQTYDRNHVQNFDNSASDKYPAFLDSYAKNFSVTNNNNQLVINPLGQYLRRKYWADPTGDRGTARYIPNEYYKNVLAESYSIMISNANKYLSNASGQIADNRFSQGTAWILDYHTNTQNQIDKLYLATNLHVAADIISPQPNDSIYTNVLSDSAMKANADSVIQAKTKLNQIEGPVAKMEQELQDIEKKYGKDSKEWKELNQKFEEALVPYNDALKAFKQAEGNITGITTLIRLGHFNSSTPIGNELKQTNKDTHADIFEFDPKDVKIIYAGTNFLNSSPSSYLDANLPYKNLEEMADFAVLEFNLNTNQNVYNYLTPNDDEGLDYNSFNNYNDYILYLTSAYQNKDNQSKPANYDLLTTYDDLYKEKLTVDNKQVTKVDYNFLALGFPNAKDDDDLVNSLSNKNDIPSLAFTSSVWVNKPSKHRKDNKNSSQLGSGLSQNLALRTFIDKPGLTDIMISNPIINVTDHKGFEVKYLKEKNSPYQGNSYINYGLGYVLQNWQPAPGGSGSSVRDLNGNIIGITYLAADTNLTSLVSISQALRSPGYNYNGQYGNYNLEQYDLIYGGGQDQRTSYRQALQLIYGDSYQTKLFPNGVNIIPDEYKFNK